jgi:anti-sigma factor ChrR (cupin superfamily)
MVRIGSRHVRRFGGRTKRADSEEVLVMQGVFNDGTLDYPTGTFIHHPIGSSHIPQSKTGCTLFLFYPEK